MKRMTIIFSLISISISLMSCGVSLNGEQEVSSNAPASSAKKPEVVPATPVKGNIDAVLCTFDRPVSMRVEEISAKYLGKPYDANGPLGEGESGKYDRDPIAREDVFDCTTFVETVIARANSKTEDEFLNQMKLIRYKDGNVSFIDRNHFPSSDWIPNNIEAGFVRDITLEVAGKSENVEVAKTEIDRKNWYWSMDLDKIQAIDAPIQDRVFIWADLRLEGRTMQMTEASLPYLPLEIIFPEVTNPDQAQIDRLKKLLDDKIKEHEGNKEEARGRLNEQEFVDFENAFSELKAGLRFQILALTYFVNQDVLSRIPSGSVVNIVRPNWDIKNAIGTNMNVSHQGLLIRKDGTLYLRHASLKAGKVVEEALVPYLLAYRNSRSVKGINILDIVDQTSSIVSLERHSNGGSGLGNSCPMH